VDRHVPAAALSGALGQADFVVVAKPLGAEARGLIGKDAFAAMKHGAFLVNVARGPVVDREALIEALTSGQLAGVGLDVFWEEPADPQDPLFSLNVVTTPHIGGATDVSFRGIAAAVAENVNRIRRDELPRNCVNATLLDPEALRAKLRR
jgi:phosphoglycerate dehydrogenase-like enzyme